jgi:glucose-6-phosphate 1-dehydrogenase
VYFFLGTGNPPETNFSNCIQFKNSPHKIFKDDIMPNRLIISIQPELKFVCFLKVRFLVTDEATTRGNDFTYQENYSESLPKPMPFLLRWNDATLFMRADQVDAAWKVVMPILMPGKFSKQLHFYQVAVIPLQGNW